MASSTNVVAAPIYRAPTTTYLRSAKRQRRQQNSCQACRRSFRTNQDKVHAEDDDGSTTVRGELTPTPTIMSEHPDSTDG
ncbi:hypothetical protein HO173_001525 [Letharia columbiana]|uniref:Uncharacterized protein n=1 Tax=Letharia columbiana TaxID=112416 RepID=A0A8H6G3S5_9LECA|nr:uncharacterized protein HO173_001525 [Letharia columbiana]KAF6239917.1 hypothetical protein HO173_001525 [Letharia columbiana]